MIIYGKNAVFELLSNTPSEIKEIFVAGNTNLAKDRQLQESANKSRIKINVVDRTHIERITATRNHQGIAARVSDFSYSDIGAIMDFAESSGENLFLLILDHIEDPHNLGAIIRTAEFLGVHGIIIPKDRACGVTPSVIKVSSGAAKNLRIAMVTNISQQIDELKKKDIWIVGADGSAETSLGKQDLSNLNIAVVIGNEGKGLSQKIKEKCDFLFSIPKKGKVESLNASVAAGIFLYEVGKQRG